jgi:hypothetical protein
MNARLVRQPCRYLRPVRARPQKARAAQHDVYKAHVQVDVTRRKRGERIGAQAGGQLGFMYLWTFFPQRCPVPSPTRYARKRAAGAQSHLDAVDSQNLP